MRLAQPATGPQMRGQLTFESAASLDVQGLIDRFVRHPHLRSIRVVLAQSVSDLLGTVLELQSCLDLSAQGKVRRELPGSVTSAFPVGIRLADTGQIRGPAGSYVLRVTRRATQLTTDRRGVSVETPGDIPHAEALDSVHRDVLAFIEREVATRASVAVWWFHTSTMAEPITTRRYRRAQGLGGFFDIAAGSDLVPEFDRELRGFSRWLIATSHCYFPHFEGCCNEPLNPSVGNRHSSPVKC